MLIPVIAVTANRDNPTNSYESSYYLHYKPWFYLGGELLLISIMHSSPGLGRNSHLVNGGPGYYHKWGAHHSGRASLTLRIPRYELEKGLSESGLYHSRIGSKHSESKASYIPLPILKGFPPNLSRAYSSCCQHKSATHGQHFALEVKQFWCKKLPNLVYQKLKMQFAFFFSSYFYETFRGRGYNLIKHKYGWF